MSTASVRGAGRGRVRRAGLALVMLGALSVSVRGQVEAVRPLLGDMSLVLALTHDLAAALALNEVITTRRAEVRGWAWAVLLLAGGTAAGLNTWHAVASGQLPAGWAVLVGIGPVLLAMLLSHLVALVLTDHPATAASAGSTRAVPTDRTDTGTAPTAAAPAAAAGRPAPTRDAAPTAAESSRDGPVGTPLAGPGVHAPLAVVPASAAPRAPADRRVGPDPRVERLGAQLRAGAELTGALVAEQLGCSERTGRRLLRQAADQLAEPGVTVRRQTG